MWSFHRIVVVFACLVAGSAALAGCPDYQQWGARYAFDADQLHRNVSFGVTAGGQNRLERCHNVRTRRDEPVGWVTEAPDFTFDLSGMRGHRLTIEVVSQCDAVLLVNLPDTRWRFDDDSRGNYDPRLVLRHPEDGLLDVWVGTYERDYCDARLILRAEPRWRHQTG